MKNGLTPGDCRKKISDVFTAVLSGMRKNKDGVIIPDRKKSVITENDLYKAMAVLAKEFPEFLPGYFVQNIGDFPQCDELEDIIFTSCAFNVLRRGSRGHDRTFTIEPKLKKLFLEPLFRDNPERYLPLVERFNDLVNSKVAK